MKSNYDKLRDQFGKHLNKVRGKVLDAAISLEELSEEADKLNEGKMLRPLFCFCIGNREIDEQAINFAASIEIVHNASLIHDDLLDKSITRRGQVSFPAREGANSALLYGDSLMSEAALLCLDQCGTDKTKSLLRAVKDMCRGELLQEQQKFCGAVSSDVYMKIISLKTASLFRAAAEGIRPESPKARFIAEKCGAAFQISNDLEDTEADSSAGIYTLPYILACESESLAEVFGRHRVLAAGRGLELLDEAEKTVINSKEDFGEEIITFIRYLQERLLEK
ncbi:All-trans-nonaprenyl-diphosphate synthase (geranyl-diphosphate specific) [Sedimentisphaera cyanobacteriorum]|uniref:All-trans-nonaprenyl-diphosphate synthase (Geranyl-diphosphate specific) n=1 Tax=Sedimentisphaera cyanobacteriorum TaxID=1940790 RepID=A0A1Q2HSR3_9BACT|nr:polyprenyl synthetase family protein [Sedimentisphaera cyanobacteriorum]AQQ10499.1 All-trans-nonaprenyl-diphosphate synthase (geranyl-diphosphate specific) [Sedimentisphaera cyanobacteriorum]